MPMACSRAALIAALSLAGMASSLPAVAATPSPQVQPYVMHAQPLLAITRVRVIDGHGTPARENQTVLLRDGRIAAVAQQSFEAVHLAQDVFAVPIRDIEVAGGHDGAHGQYLLCRCYSGARPGSLRRPAAGGRRWSPLGPGRGVLFALFAPRHRWTTSLLSARVRR